MLLLYAISIHPPRAGRDLKEFFVVVLFGISIHPPRAGRDRHSVLTLWLLQIFQSTRPVRGGTEFSVGVDCGGDRISIHPPHAGRDHIIPVTVSQRQNFNPPAPCGAGLDGG